MRLKRLLAVALATTMVFSSSLVAFADGPDRPYGEVTIEGEGIIEGLIQEVGGGKIAVMLPTADNTDLEFLIDPQELLVKSGGQAFAESIKSDPIEHTDSSHSDYRYFHVGAENNKPVGLGLVVVGNDGRIVEGLYVDKDGNIRNRNDHDNVVDSDDLYIFWNYSGIEKEDGEYDYGAFYCPTRSQYSKLNRNVYIDNRVGASVTDYVNERDIFAEYNEVAGENKVASITNTKDDNLVYFTRSNYKDYEDENVLLQEEKNDYYLSNKSDIIKIDNVGTVAVDVSMTAVIKENVSLDGSQRITVIDNATYANAKECKDIIDKVPAMKMAVVAKVTDKSLTSVSHEGSTGVGDFDYTLISDKDHHATSPEDDQKLLPDIKVTLASNQRNLGVRFNVDTGKYEYVGNQTNSVAGSYVEYQFAGWVNGVNTAGMDGYQDTPWDIFIRQQKSGMLESSLLVAPKLEVTWTVNTHDYGIEKATITSDNSIDVSEVQIGVDEEGPILGFKDKLVEFNVPRGQEFIGVFLKDSSDAEVNKSVELSEGLNDDYVYDYANNKLLFSDDAMNKIKDAVVNDKMTLYAAFTSTLNTTDQYYEIEGEDRVPLGESSKGSFYLDQLMFDSNITRIPIKVRYSGVESQDFELTFNKGQARYNIPKGVEILSIYDINDEKMLGKQNYKLDQGYTMDELEDFVTSDLGKYRWMFKENPVDEPNELIICTYTLNKLHKFKVKIKVGNTTKEITVRTENRN